LSSFTRLKSLEMEEFEYTVAPLGFQRYGYAGAFTPQVEKIILSLIQPPTLHLFSGKSKIGDERVDIMCKEATINDDVFNFIKHDERLWLWCILDPPYNIASAKKKLKQYKIYTPVSSSVPKRRALAKYFREHVQNVLWLDLCAPLPHGFKRVKLWFLFPGGYRHIRVLSWLKNRRKIFNEGENRNGRQRG